MRILIFTLTVIFLLSCNLNQETNRNNANIDSTLAKSIFTNPKVFFKRFEANISGNSKLFLYVSRNSNSIEGDSILHLIIDNPKENEPIEFIGIIRPLGNFELSHYLYDSEIKITGNFINDSTINLNLKNLKEINIDSLEFKETYKNLMIYPKNFYKSHLDIQTDEELEGMCDSFISYINIDLLRFKGNFYNKLNKTIESRIIPKDIQTDIEIYFKNFEQTLFYEDIEITVIYFEKQFITLRVIDETFSCGSAHQQYSIEYINFDLNENNEISINDLFPKSSLLKIENLCKQKFIKKYEKSDDEVYEFHLPKSFAILRNGILFQFQPYEMGSFAEGAMTIFLPYSEIKGLMNNNHVTKMLLTK